MTLGRAGAFSPHRGFIDSEIDSESPRGLSLTQHSLEQLCAACLPPPASPELFLPKWDLSEGQERLYPTHTPRLTSHTSNTSAWLCQTLGKTTAGSSKDVGMGAAPSCATLGHQAGEGILLLCSTLRPHLGAVPSAGLPSTETMDTTQNTGISVRNFYLINYTFLL